MARGITESDVHTAADEIVGAGERPTVERIRSHLGTGSPNTVTRWLETWWRALGGRLDTHQRNLSVPEAPEAVAKLAGEWWALALKHARSEAENGLADQRTALLSAQEALRQQREGFAAEASALRDAAASATQAERLATTQTVELQRLVNQLEGRIAELGRQRDVALTRAADADAARQAVDERLQALADSTRSEREELAQHLHAIEDRAHQEVDRARTEAADLRHQLKRDAQHYKSKLIALESAADAAKTIAAGATREAGIQAARADALESQLSKLQDLPAALEAAWRARRAEVEVTRPATKRKKIVETKKASRKS